MKERRSRAGSWPLARFAALLLLWVALIGSGTLDLVLGIIAAALAALVSGRLLPGPAWRASLPASLAFIATFLRQSVMAGLDIAWRAFDPKLPLKPGFVTYRPRLAPGPARNLFTTISSMVPGTLPVGPSGSDGLLIHCLDETAPVAAELGGDEARLMQALGAPKGRAAR